MNFFLLVQNYEDNGPIIDAVVWHDGDLWRAALDTQDMEVGKGRGKLADCIPLTNFRYLNVWCSSSMALKEPFTGFIVYSPIMFE